MEVGTALLALRSMTGPLLFPPRDLATATASAFPSARLMETTGMWKVPNWWWLVVVVVGWLVVGWLS